MEHILEIKNIVKRYGDLTAVNGISFSIRKGICFGLLGPNGAGKTTTIEIIEGLIEHSSGEIFYKGKERGKSYKAEVGIQLQNTELPMYLTVKETLETYRNLYRHKANLDYLIEICELSDILNRDNQKISGGQKQRLLLAMALVNDPELIFLDEPTTGLDPQARRHLWDIVNKLKSEDKTIILTTHYMEEAENLCEEIVIMDKGKIIVMDSPDKLINKYCSGKVISLPENISIEKVKQNNLNYTINQNRLEIHESNINQTLKKMIDSGIDLSEISIRSQNLEDLFLKMTGNVLRT